MKLLVLLPIVCMLAPAATVAATSAGPTVCEARWHDAPRNRDVPVRIRMPAGNARVPLILFSHGLGGNLNAGTAWAQAWAKGGFAVINLQHPGSDSGVIGGGQFRQAMSGEQSRARTQDVRFVIDEVGRRPREGACDLTRIDRSRIGMSGHSFGAQTTLAVSGANYPGARGALTDNRITAAIALSPQPAQLQADAAAFGRIAIPFFSITGTRDEVPQLNAVTPQDRERPFRAMPPGNKYLLVLDGANHAAFGGQDTARATGGQHVRDIVTRATLLFWRATLYGDQAARRTLDGLSDLGPGDRFERR